MPLSLVGLVVLVVCLLFLAAYSFSLTHSSSYAFHLCLLLPPLIVASLVLLLLSFSPSLSYLVVCVSLPPSAPSRPLPLLSLSDTVPSSLLLSLSLSRSL